MKKRICVFLVLIFVMLGISACSKSPYDKMKLMLDKTEINLTLSENDNVLSGDSQTVVVKVDAPKNISKDIVLPKYGDGYGNEFVDIAVTSNGSGTHSLKITPIKQGYTEIQIKTFEGYVSQTLAINIDVAITELHFKSDASAVVEVGGTFDFNVYSKSLLDFVPAYTTQTNVRFEIEDIDDYKDDINGVETQLVSIDPNTGILSIHPKASKLSNLRVKAFSTDNENVFTADTMNIRVINPLKLNNSKEFSVQLNDAGANVIDLQNISELSTTSDVYYEVVFASPDVELTAEDLENNQDKTLIFGGNLKMYLANAEYVITYTNEHPDCVTIAESATDKGRDSYTKVYNLSAKDLGEYTARFRVEYVGKDGNGKQYGISTKYINVKIKVVALPTSKTILINDQNYLDGQNIISVFDSYASGSGSRLQIKSTNNSNMLFQVHERAGIHLVNNESGNSGVVINYNNNPINPYVDANQQGDSFLSGSTLYVQNKTTVTDTAELRITLTTDISNEYYSTEQIYSKTITIKLNLITGLTKLTIPNKTLDIVNDQAGAQIVEFNEGVIASSVVEAVRYGDSRLFTYSFGEGEDSNKMFVYPTQYVPGSDTLYEGYTNFIVELVNGVRSYNEEGKDTILTVKATYQLNGTELNGQKNDWAGKTIVITKLDDKNDGFLAYSGIGSEPDYSEEFTSATQDERIYRFIDPEKDQHGVTYQNFEAVILSTYSEMDFDLYKLFTYIDAEGKKQIGYVNANTLRAEISRNNNHAYDYVQWADGKLSVYGNTTYDVDEEAHIPVEFKIYDDNEQIFKIDIYICKRIGKIALEKKHFDLYDGTNDGASFTSLNSVYDHLSEATLNLKVWAIGQGGELIEDEDIVPAEYGNLYRFYTMIGENNNISNSINIQRKNLLTLDESKTNIRAGLTTSIPGEPITTTLANIYESDRVFNYDGRVRQFNQEFVVDFSVNVSYAHKSKNISTTVDDELGVYFEQDESDKIYKFNYTIYSGNATFQDVFIEVMTSDEQYCNVVLFNNEYKKDADGNYILNEGQKVRVYKSYTTSEYGLFDPALYSAEIRFDEGKYTIFDTDENDYVEEERIVENYNVGGQYFYFQIGNDGVINFRTTYTTPGSYIIRINTVDSYSDTDHEFKVSEDFNVYIADGSISAPYQIRSTKDFETFLKDRNTAGATAKHYVLATDIYLNRTFTNDLYRVYLNKPLYHHLSGQFIVKDSSGYREYNRKIYGLNITLSDISDLTNIGLFTSLQDVSVRYINLENVNITISNISGEHSVNVGALVAELAKGSDATAQEKRSIVGAKVNGSITINNATNTLDLNVGGIVGKYTGGVITGLPDDRLAVNNSDINSTIKIEYISNKSANLGGIAGYIGEGVTLSDVRAIASIVARNTSTDENADYIESKIGGIAGATNNATIDNVISYPIVIGYSTVGGIVGTMEKTTIANSQVQLLYNANIKNVIAGLDKVGGVAGSVLDDTSSLVYTYVRSYTTKSFVPFTGRANIEFYQDYNNKYYGSIVLLNGVGSAVVGGMIGNGYAHLTNSNFMSNVVSYNPSAKIGAVVGSLAIKVDALTTINGTIDLNKSYVDGKIVYYDHSQNRYYNSFNIITAPKDSTQTFIAGSGSTSDFSPAIEGTLTTGSDGKNSYIVITNTNTINNSVVQYSDKFDDFSAKQFYARVNNTLFGFDSATATNTFEYRSFSDKTEKVTIIIYNDGVKLRMYARSQVYENSPSGVTYSNNLLGKLPTDIDSSQYGTNLPIWGMSTTGEIDSSEMRGTTKELSELLIGLGMYTDTDRYYYSKTVSGTTTYNKDSDWESLIALFSGLGANNIDSSYSVDGEGLTAEEIDKKKEEKRQDALSDVSKECQILVSNDPSDNVSELRIIDTINASNIKVNITGTNGGSVVATFDKKTSSGVNYEFTYDNTSKVYSCTSQGVVASDLKNVRLLASDYRALTKTSYKAAQTGLNSETDNFEWKYSQYSNSGIYTDSTDKYFYAYNGSTGKSQLFKLTEETDASSEVELVVNEQIDTLFYNNADGKFYQLSWQDGEISTTVVENLVNQFIMFSNGTNFYKYKLDLQATIPAYGLNTSDHSVYFQPDIQMVYLAETHILNENLESADGSYKIIGDSIYYNNEKVDETLRYYKKNYSVGLSITNTAVTPDKILSPLYFDVELQDKNKDGEIDIADLFGYGEKDSIDGEITVTYDDTTYYRYGNDWYSDSSYTNLIEEEYILNQLSGKKTNSYYEVIRTAYYKDGDWYKDDQYNEHLAYYNQGDKQYYEDTNFNVKMDLSIMNQLIGKTEDTKYYVKRDAYYNSEHPKYFADNNGKAITINSENLISSLDFGNTYIVEKKFSYNGGEWCYLKESDFITLDSTTDATLISYLESMKQGSEATIKIYRSQWKDINNNPIYDVNGLEQLKGKNYASSYNVMQLAYYLDNWYSDPNYVEGKASASLAITLNSSAQEYEPTIYINPFNIVINGQVCEFESYTDDVTDMTNQIASYVKGSDAKFGLVIKNNILYVLTQNATDNFVIDTMIVDDELHYVIGKAQIQADVTDGSKKFADWLVNSKINNNLPTSIKANYNLDVRVIGNSYDHGLIASTYSLYYDELATLSLKANPFTPLDGAENSDKNYISGDKTNPHGHIKVDETSVVLMYNTPINNIDVDKQDEADNANKYQISFGEQEGHYVAVLNGIIVDLSGIEIDKDSALQLFITSSDNTVVSIERDTNSNNFIVTVKGEGEAEINFYNLKDDGIKATLKVYVIKGFTNFKTFDESGAEVSRAQGDYGLSAIVGDKPSYYMFKFINEANDITFEANNGGFRLELVSIDGIENLDGFVDKDAEGKSLTYSEIKINNFRISKENFLSKELKFDFNSPNLSFLAINQTNKNITGTMVFKVVPYVMCAGKTVYIDYLEKTITLTITNPAQEINFSETDNEQMPDESKSVSVSIHSNCSNEKLILKVKGDDWNEAYFEISDSYEMIQNNDSLLQFRLINYGCTQVDLNGVKMYRHTYTLTFSMNQQEYLTKTLNSGQNAIASSKNYTFVAYPSSWCDYKDVEGKEGEKEFESVKDKAIFSKYSLTISPVTADKISTAFYPYLTTYFGKASNETTDELDKIKYYELDQIYDINALPPDRFGLLKIEINPKYNNTLIVQAEIDKQYVGLIQFKQVVSIPYEQIDTKKYGLYQALAGASNSNINISNIYTLWDVPYKMTKDDNWDSSQEWILSEYYLAVFIQPNCPQGINIPITIRAFDDNRNEILRDVVDLFVEPIPQVSITIDNEESVIRGVDEYVPLQIQADNVEADALKIAINKIVGDSSSASSLPLYTYNTSTKSYIEVPGNNIVPGGQYYLRTAKLASNSVNYAGSIGKYTLTVSTSKYIHGIEFSVSDSASIQVVWLTIESVAERDVISDVVTMKTGMFKGLAVVVNTNKTKPGKGINDFDTEVNSKVDTEVNSKVIKLKAEDTDDKAMTPNEYLEYLQNKIAGRNNYTTSYWYYYHNDTYTKLDSTGAAYNNFMFTRYNGSGSDADEGYFRISAIQMGIIKLRLSFHYNYDARGIVEIGTPGNNDGKDWLVYDYEFSINIKENSSEDSPLPIYDIDDLMNMESGSNYILQADLTLSNWEPIPFNAKYLDGNGFTISVQSFNTTNLKGTDEAYVGIFTHIAEGSTVKNLNVDISGLLYGDNALSKLRNDEQTPNIDLRETPIVHFGVLAGENLGTIINTKIVNIDGRKNNYTLYVGITRGYFTYDEESVLTQGYIGGLVAQNSGVITNSYIGLNKLEQVERTVSSTTEFTTVLSYTYPFKIEACNNVGGFVYANSGTITNSYVKSVSIVNGTRVSDGGSTAGFVCINSGEIYSTAVTDIDIDKFKAQNTTITSSTMTGGFVYINSGIIEDSYTTVQIQNQNVATAGFVYNNADGSIKNSYTTSKNTAITSGTGNTESHGLFVYEKGEYGTIENCFYLILDNELGSSVNDAELLRALDPAYAIIKGTGDKLTEGEFPGFSFASSATDYDGIWYLPNEGATFPELSFAENVDYFSLRQLVNISTTYFRTGVVDVDGKHTADVSMEVYQEDDDTEKVLEKYNSLTRKTNVWYFNNGNRMFEVVGNTIIEVNSNAEMAVETKVEGSDVYFAFTYDSIDYKVYYGNNTDYGIKVNIGGIDKRIANYSFVYLNFEFIVIREHNIVLEDSIENVETCAVSFKMVTNNGFNIITMANVTGKTNEFVYGGNSTYSYSAVKNNIGSKYNPIVVTNSEEFARYIVSNTNEYVLADNTTRSYVFGLTENTGDGVYARYIHLANDIDFKNDGESTDINIATKYEVNNSTSMITINDVIFNGVIIGNSMGINNIILNSKEVRDNYGIFNEVGVNDALRQELSSYASATNIPTAQVFNLKLQYLELSNSSANKVGLLAGTISNAVINKVDITGVNTVDDESQIIGQNLTGALAGLIYGKDGSTKVSEITVSNANISSVVNQLSNFSSSTIASSQKYDKFKDSGTSIEADVKEIIFGSYVDLSGTTHDDIRVITNLDNAISEPSYAGAIAGAIVIDTEVKEESLKQSALDNYSSYDALRTNSSYFYIKDLKVMDMINIQADVSGGIAGYIGARDKDTTDADNIKEYGVFVSDLLLELEDSEQQNIFGYGYAGGLVGQTENAYIIQSQVTHTQEVQDEIDKKINEITSDKISSSLLFSKNQSATEYNIGIGGIVGRMHNTWVVDSMSKVNVENQNSFIAGGIAGFITGSNYLAYVYATGNVLAKNMIGGLVGYYYIDNGETYNLNLYNAFAVNIWNKSIKDLLAVNEEAYAYEKYTDSGWVTLEDYEKIFIGEFNSMPELGNQQTSRASIPSNESITLKLLDKTTIDKSITDETVKICDSSNNVIYSIRFYTDGDEREVTYQGYTFKLIWSSANGVSCEKSIQPEAVLEKTSYYDVDYSATAEKTITITPYVRTKVNNEYLGFAAYERFTFIGSVMGRVSQYKLSKNQDILSHIDFYNEFGDSSTGVIKDDTKQLKQIVSRTNIAVSGENEEYYTYYNAHNFNVISSTYGMVEHEGSISEGDYESIIAEDKINLSYFKSTYACADTNYNSYNIDNFQPMFGKQYYISYITGDYINNSTSTSIGNKYYVNEFTEYYGYTFDVVQSQPITIDGFDYSKDLYLSNANLDKIKTLVDETLAAGNGEIKSLSLAVASLGFDTSMTWYVDNNFYLAKYGYNSNSTFVLIDTEQKLYEALTDGKSGMMYRIDLNQDHKDGVICEEGEDYEYHVSNLGTSDIRYNITNNIYFASSVTKIKFSPDNTQGIVNLFNVITSTTFMNISFIFDLNEVEEIQTNSLDNSFGFFANTIVSSVFENCSFTFSQTSGSLTAKLTSNDTYVTTMGFVAGMVSNTVFQGCPVDYDIDSAITMNQNIVQFGGYVGHSFQSTFVDSSIDGNLSIAYEDKTAADKIDEIEHSFGGFIGEAQSSRIQSITYQGTFNVSASSLQSTTYNIGIFIGKAHGSTTIFDVDVFKYVIADDSEEEYSVTITAKNTKSPTTNIGIFGQIDSITSIENIKGMVNSSPQFDNEFNYVSFGDSISRGYFLPDDPIETKGEKNYAENLRDNNGMVNGSYVKQFADNLAGRGNNFDSINAINYAQDGDTTADLLTKLRSNTDIRRDIMKADVISISIGANDLLSVLDVTKLVKFMLTGNQDIVNDLYDSIAVNTKNNIPQIFEEINKLNKYAKVYVSTVYNPYKAFLDSSLGDYKIELWECGEFLWWEWAEKLYELSLNDSLYKMAKVTDALIEHIDVTKDKNEDGAYADSDYNDGVYTDGKLTLSINSILRENVAKYSNFEIVEVKQAFDASFATNKRYDLVNVAFADPANRTIKLDVADFLVNGLLSGNTWEYILKHVINNNDLFVDPHPNVNGHNVIANLYKSVSYTPINGRLYPAELKISVGNAEGSGNSTVNAGAIGMVRGGRGLTIKNFDNRLGMNINATNIDGRTILSIGGLIGNKSGTSKVNVTQCVNYGTMNINSVSNEKLTINAGGFVGKSAGMIIQQSVNLATLKINSSHETGYVSFGGMIGSNSSGAISLNNVINYGDLEFTLENNKEYRIGGLVGNVGDRALTTNYTLALGNMINGTNNYLIFKDSVNGFAHNYRELSNMNSHYIAEHDPRTAYNTNSTPELNYKVDDLTNEEERLMSIAWQYVDAIKKDSDGDSNLSDASGSLIKWKSDDGSVLPVVDGLNYKIPSADKGLGSKHNPKYYTDEELPSSTFNSTNNYKYIIVTKDTELYGSSFEIANGTILTSDEKSGIDVKVKSVRISKNKGVISNIKFVLTMPSVSASSNTALVITDNYGSLMNVGISNNSDFCGVVVTGTTGGTGAKLAPILTNYGGVYATGSMYTLISQLTVESTTYTGRILNGAEISYLVHANNGEILNSYTTSDADTVGEGTIEFGAIAHTNNGVIRNVFFGGTVGIVDDVDNNTEDEIDDSGEIIVKVAYEYYSIIYELGDNGTRPTNYFSDKNRLKPNDDKANKKSAGNKKTSDMKNLITDGYLSSYLWETGNWNKELPFIKNGVELKQVFGDNATIRNIPDYNAWVYQILDRDDTTNTRTINFDINDFDEVEIDKDFDGLISNSGTINIKNFRGLGEEETIQMPQSFIKDNSGTIQLAGGGVGFKGLEIYNDDGGDSSFVITNKSTGSISVKMDNCKIETGYIAKTNEGQLTITEIKDSIVNCFMNTSSGTTTITMENSECTNSIIESHNTSTLTITMENSECGGSIVKGDNSGTLTVTLEDSGCDAIVGGNNTGIMNVSMSEAKCSTVVGTANSGTLNISQLWDMKGKDNIIIQSNSGDINFDSGSGSSSTVVINATIQVTNNLDSGDINLDSSESDVFDDATLIVSSNYGTITGDGADSTYKAFNSGSTFTITANGSTSDVGKVQDINFYSSTFNVGYNSKKSTTMSTIEDVALEASSKFIINQNDGQLKNFITGEGASIKFEPKDSYTGNNTGIIDGLNMTKGKLEFVTTDGKGGTNSGTINKLTLVETTVTGLNTNSGELLALDIQGSKLNLTSNTGIINGIKMQGGGKPTEFAITTNASTANVSMVMVSTLGGKEYTVDSDYTYGINSAKFNVATNNGNVYNILSSGEYESSTPQAGSSFITTNTGLVKNINVSSQTLSSPIIATNRDCGTIAGIITIDSVTLRGKSKSSGIVCGVSAGGIEDVDLSATNCTVDMEEADPNGQAGIFFGWIHSNKITINSAYATGCTLKSEKTSHDTGLFAGLVGWWDAEDLITTLLEISGLDFTNSNKITAVNYRDSNHTPSTGGNCGIGGVIGYVYSGVKITIEGSSNTTITTGGGASYNGTYYDATYNIGGIIGYFGGDNFNKTSGTVTCGSTINITNKAANVGGIFGKFVKSGSFNEWEGSGTRMAFTGTINTNGNIVGKFLPLYYDVMYSMNSYVDQSEIQNHLNKLKDTGMKDPEMQAALVMAFSIDLGMIAGYTRYDIDSEYYDISSSAKITGLDNNPNLHVLEFKYEHSNDKNMIFRSTVSEFGFSSTISGSDTPIMSWSRELNIDKNGVDFDYFILNNEKSGKKIGWLAAGDGSSWTWQDEVKNLYGLVFKDSIYHEHNVLTRIDDNRWKLHGTEFTGDSSTEWSVIMVYSGFKGGTDYPLPS